MCVCVCVGGGGAAEGAVGVISRVCQVDILSYQSNKRARITEQLKDICAILSGLFVASDYRKGQALVRDRDFAANEEFFHDVFEIGRRYKVRAGVCAWACVLA